MPVTVVQSNGGSTGTTAAPATATATLPVGTTAGNTLLLGVSSDATVNTPAGFTLDKSQVNNNGHYLFRKATTAGETSWVITPTSAVSTAWWVQEVSGLAASPVDQTISTGAATTGSTRSTGTTPATAQADDYLVATFGWSMGAGTTATWASYTNSFTEVSGTAVGSNKASGTNTGLVLATRIASATGAYESTATTTGSVSVASTGILVAYKIATVSATPFVGWGVPIR